MGRPSKHQSNKKDLFWFVLNETLFPCELRPYSCVNNDTANKKADTFVFILRVDKKMKANFFFFFFFLISKNHTASFKL